MKEWKKKWPVIIFFLCNPQEETQTFTLNFLMSFGEALSLKRIPLRLKHK